MNIRGQLHQCAIVFLLAHTLSLYCACSEDSSESKVSVLTQRYNNARTGANLSEHILNVHNVNAKSKMFGKLFSIDVDGNVVAQPLVVPEVRLLPDVVRDMLLVATEKNNVYAVDANTGEQIWMRNLGPSVPASDITALGRGPLRMGDTFDYKDLYPDIGITSTPVIDKASETIFVVAKTKRNLGSTAVYLYRLHALDLRTGSESQAPVEIKGAVAGSARDAKHNQVVFDPTIQLNRPGLLLLNQHVYIAFGSHADAGPFHGWLFRYNSEAIEQPPLIFCTTPDEDSAHRPPDRDPDEWNRGGIWQSGTGIAADEQNAIYFSVGDGAWNGKRNLSNSFLKLDESLETLDWFTPWNHSELDSQDLDVGSSGVVLLPQHLLIGGSKEGTLYILDRGDLGKVSKSAHTQATRIVQQLQVTQLPKNPPRDCGNCFRHVHGPPVIWPAEGGLRMFIWPEMETLKSYLMADRHFTPAGESVAVAPMPMPGMLTAMPGGILALSSDGEQADTAILWSSMPLDADANRKNVPGILRAFAASDITHELWNSEMYSADKLGYFAKFATPTIANGKVYVATFAPESNYPSSIQTGAAQVVVYGLFGNSRRKHSRHRYTSVKTHLP